MTLCYVIKNKDTGLFKHTLRKVYIIFQLLVIGKPNYATTILRQLYIFDIKAIDPVLKDVPLANVLDNLKGQFRTFYKMDLLLKHKNKEFKQFQINCRLFLKKNNDIFWFNDLLVDTLRKVRFSIN